MSGEPEVGFHQLPVTALAFLDVQSLLIAGQGSHLGIFDCQTHEKLYSNQLLKGQAIHGIAVYNVGPSRRIALVWGGPIYCAALIDISRTDFRNVVVDVHIGPLNTCNDWILNCSFEPETYRNGDDNPRAAIITAHDAALLVKFHLSDILEDTSLPPRLCLETTALSASTQCMLYSAHAEWLSSDHILVVAGTPFGTIIVWSCSINKPLENAELQVSVQIEYVFTAHENSAVFGVLCVRDLALPDRLLVASCSDDRSIKVWDVSRALTNRRPLVNGSHVIESTDRPAHPAVAPQKTHISPERPRFHANVLPFGPQQLYGHISRIWDIVLCKQGSSGTSSTRSPLLVSLGEDATVQVWLMSETLSHVATHENHFGKNVWSSATCFEDRGYPYVITGGADGAIVATKPRLLFEQHDYQQFEASNESFHTGTSELSHVDLQDWTKRLKAYSFVDCQTLLATSTDGHIVLGKLTDMKPNKHPVSPQFSYRSVAKFDNLKSYSTTVGLSPLGIGFVAGTEGTIYCYHNNHVQPNPIIQSKGKVSALFAEVLCSPSSDGMTSLPSEVGSVDIALLTTQTRSDSARVYFLTTELVTSTCVSVTSGHPSPTSHQISLSDASVLALCLPKSAVVTSMLYLRLASVEDLVLLGTRSGTVSIYLVSDKLSFNWTEDASKQQTRKVEPVRLSPFSHHQDAVTCMKWSEREFDKETPGNGFLLSTGRDSTCAIHRYCLADLTAPPELVHRVSLPFGPNVEGFYFNGPEHSIHLYGFRGEDFVVVEASTHIEKIKVRCGGAHRIWAFQPPTADADAAFIWTRASKIHSHVATMSSNQWLQPGGHGREIKTCAVCPTPFSGSRTRSSLIATGAEDTEIRLFECTPSSSLQRCSKLRSVAILRGHVTGLQHLQFSADGEYLFSSGGREEFKVWRLQRTAFVPIGVVCESSVPPMNALSDLRIMGFDVMPVEAAGLEARTRSSREFIIVLVLSNSTIRIYRYTCGIVNNPAWQLLATANHGACCLSLGHFLLQPQMRRQQIAPENRFLVGATDGSIAVYDFQGLAQVDSRPTTFKGKITNLVGSRLHQNTVKCLEIIPLASPATEATAEAETETEPETRPRTFLAIGGGDDNALSFTLIRGTNKTGPTGKLEMDTLFLPRAHAASINGLVAWKIAPSDAGLHRYRLATVSNDQRLKVWAVDVDVRKPGVTGVQIEKVSNTFSCVADVSSMALLGGGIDRGQDDAWSSGGGVGVRLLVCGVGMEVWTVPHEGNKINGDLQYALDGS